ncbi:MAG: XdhC family protein [Myxococcota bacterium]
MDRVHQKAQELEANGEGYVLATVIRAVAPTSAKPGDKAVISETGTVHGWVGGSCAEPTVKKEAKLALADGACRVVQITPEPVRADAREGLIVVPMTCYSGGELEIYLEPHVAKRDLVVFGNSPVAEALIRLGVTVGYRVTVVDLTERPPLEGADVVNSLEALALPRPHEAAMIVATHGVFDEDALCHALALEPEYLGVVASPRRFASLRGTLRRRGVEDDALSKVDGPAGIDIGASTPSEIALSILAAVTANRQSVEVTTRRHAETPESPGTAADDAAFDAEDSTERGSCCHD